MRYVQKSENYIACENIRFSSLFAAGDVSRGGTSAKRMFSQAKNYKDRVLKFITITALHVTRRFQRRIIFLIGERFLILGAEAVFHQDWIICTDDKFVNSREMIQWYIRLSVVCKQMKLTSCLRKMSPSGAVYNGWFNFTCSPPPGQPPGQVLPFGPGSGKMFEVVLTRG